MSKEEKKLHLAISRRRYAVIGTKKAKGRILDKYCEMTGATAWTRVRCVWNKGAAGVKD